MRIRLAQVLQAVACGVGGELVEPDGVVDGGEIVVEQNVVALLQERGGLCVGQLGEQAAGGGDARGGVEGCRGCGRQQDFAEHAARVASGVGVVAPTEEATPFDARRSRQRASRRSPSASAGIQE